MINCKVCLNQTRPIYDQQYDLNYYYCPKCEFILIDENKIISADQEKKAYSSHHNSLANEGYVQMFRDFIAQAIAPHRSRIKTVLDFGSGPTPVLAELLRREGFTVDIHDKYFAPDNSYLKKKYDLIAITEVLEHLNDPLETLRSLKSRLNPKGIIAIMTLFHPNNDETFLQWWYRRDKTHISFYTPKTIEVMARFLEMGVEMTDNKRICVIGLL